MRTIVKLLAAFSLCAQSCLSLKKKMHDAIGVSRDDETDNSPRALGVSFGVPINTVLLTLPSASCQSCAFSFLGQGKTPELAYLLMMVASTCLLTACIGRLPSVDWDVEAVDLQGMKSELGL